MQPGQNARRRLAALAPTVAAACRPLAIMGSATSVVRKPLREQDADQLASALAHDQRLEEYAHVVRAKGLTGAMVSHMSADEVVKALDIADAGLANHLGALLAYEKSAKAASEAHRATLEAAAGSPVKEEDAEHEMVGQLALMRQVRESMRNGDASDAHLAETANTSSYCSNGRTSERSQPGSVMRWSGCTEMK